MSLTWQTVDKWRAERDMAIAEVARRGGIPERTIYFGIAANSRLRAGTKSAMQRVFPDKFDENGEVRE